MSASSSPVEAFGDHHFSSDICRTRISDESGVPATDTVPSESMLDLRCKYYKSNARKWWRVDILVNALSALNYPVTVECVSSTGSLSPMVYDSTHNVIRIAPSSFYTPFSFRRSLAKGLVYAFDQARANVDYSNIDHLTCTSIRGTNISGECDLWTKWTDYIGEDPLGMHMYSMKQRCVRNQVRDSILIQASSRYTAEEVDGSIDKVWDRCFRDHWPFTAEPHMDTRYRDSPIVRDQ